MSKSSTGERLTLRAAAEEIVRTLRDAGHEALFAGGCVRDLLLNSPPTDIDVATSARPEQVLKLFRRTRAVGKQFGVVLVRRGGHEIEVATFRTDASYSDGRHPDAVHYGTAREDAQRRDFTINGMFFDPLDLRVIDYVEGQRDLQRRVVRAIGDPRQRFAEDHLRLLRAVRFAARLGFDIDPATWEAVFETAPMLRRVSAERIADELSRMLTAATRCRAWALLAKSRLVEHLWPGAERLAGRVGRIAALLAPLPDEVSFELVLAILALPDSDEARAVCDALRASNAVKRSVVWLVDHHADLERPEGVSVARLKRLMADPAFDELLLLLRARLLADGRGDDVWRVMRDRTGAIAPRDVAPPPLLTGDDLIAMGVPPGPRYKRILDAVYDAQLNGEIADSDAAAAMARTLVAAMN